LSPLFPYTTLFRSQENPAETRSRSLRPGAPHHGDLDRRVPGIIQSKHSLRIVPMTRSQMEFAFGLLGGLFNTRSPNRRMDSSTSAEKMLSRSCSRYLYRSSYPTASRSCCRVHCAVGCAVTLKWISRRL